MSTNPTYDVALEEGDEDRLRSTIAPDAIPVDLVSAFAGDRRLTEAERVRVSELKAARGAVFFSDLLYAISHHYFAPEVAEGIWQSVLAHKVTMSEKVGRNVRITVATLDYLSNVTGQIRALTLISETYVAEIVNLSLRDGMTGLFNHSTCYELLEMELRHHRRYGVGVAVILLDLDDFKAVNDSLGHQEGDRVLHDLGRVLGEATRDSDICCRFGGEEFAVILPFTDDPQEAFAIAERIRTGVLGIACEGHPITISAGVALADGPTETSAALVQRADRALYRAKRAGKNKVIVSSVNRS